MTDSSFDIKEQIRDAVNIVDLVSRYVPSLRRQGRNYVGRCPWHDDSRPSLQVNPERQTFKCWVCDIGGDIFSFVMKMENVDFREALEILADVAGIAIPEKKGFFKVAQEGKVGGSAETVGFVPLPNTGVGGGGNFSANRPAGIGVEITKPILYRALDWLSMKYHRFFLEDPEAEPARNYIRERGISDEMIRRFKIGCAPLSGRAVLDWVEMDRDRVRILEAAGVLAQRQDDLLATGGSGATLLPVEANRYYDRFRGRVLFPIRDNQERTVAFGGRVIPGSSLNSPAKYVNSPETVLFSKSRMLYGLDIARNNIRKKKRVLITEGYTDTIIAHQFGFDETVAVLGTALGEYHVNMLNRFADHIILILDGDEAGRKRVDEVLGLFVAQGADLAILTLPDDLDPCEFILERGAEAFAHLVDSSAVDAMDHAFAAATHGIDLEKDIVGTSKALDRLLSIIAAFPVREKTPGDPLRIRMAKTIQRLSERFRISEDEIRRNLRRHRERLAGSSAYSDSRIGGRENGNAENRVTEGGEGREGDVRTEFLFPNGEFRDETENALVERFQKIPQDVWENESLRPNHLEREFLEFWFTVPEWFEVFLGADSPLFSDQAEGENQAGSESANKENGAEMESVAAVFNEPLSADDFRSPIARQLFLLGTDLANRGAVPTFERILLRYDDPKMKNFLVEIDDAAREKDLGERLVSETTRRRLADEIFYGFQRQRISVQEPRKIIDLRKEDLSAKEKLQKLLEIQELLKRKQERIGKTDLMDEDGPKES